MDVINVAQLGDGYWGPNLLRNLAASPAFKVSRVADLSADDRAEFGRFAEYLRSRSAGGQV